jgi:hypothetical protein
LGCAFFGPCAHASSPTPPKAFGSVCGVARSMFRPTRAIQMFDCQREAPDASWGYCHRFRTGSWAVSWRYHPAPLALADTSTACAMGVEPLTRRHHRRCSLVPGSLATGLEPSRPPCGEAEWRPDSCAPLTAAALCRDSSMTGTRLGTRRPMQPSRPTDTFGARCAPPPPRPQCCRDENGHLGFVACAPKPRVKPDCVALRPRPSPP